MTIKAKASLTVTDITDVVKVTPFWLAQSSTAATPAKPTTTTTAAGTGSWSKTMPAYDSSKRCYTCTRSERGDGSCYWSDVTEDQGWKGANAANSTATSAANTASNASKTAQDAKKTADGISVGGRNIARGTATLTNDVQAGEHPRGFGTCDYLGGIKSMGVSTAWSGIYFRLKDMADAGRIKAGQQYTASVYVMSETDLTTTFQYYRFTSSSNKPTVDELTGSSNEVVDLKAGEWHQLKCTFTATSGDDSTLTSNRARIENTSNVEVWYAGPKLESGNRATDYSPAPEDVDAAIGTAQDTADSAKSTAQTAASDAATAKSTADSAKTAAGNAQSTADTAVANAAKAQSSADAAQAKADDAWARTLRVEVMSAPADAAGDTSLLTAYAFRGGELLSDGDVAKMGMLAWYVGGSRVATGSTYTCAAGTATECRLEA